MDIFDVLTLIGGLAMFLFGMKLMGNSLERRAGGRLKSLLENITSNPFKGFLLGVGITALVQSSSVTTVMVVGFVNSGLMTLTQSISLIMGANLGASITSWILSLSGVNGENIILQFFKPTSFTPIVALIGVILHNFTNSSKKKDTGLILMGFAILMFGMNTMSDSVSGLRDLPVFTRMIQMFSNPVVGVLVGVVITAIIQSSSASIGILQALSMTGGITYGTAIPIIMGQNIGTCISAVISCIGASKNAQRAALVHVLFNVFSTIICLPLYLLACKLFSFSFPSMAITPVSIAMVNTIYKMVSIAIISPFSKYLEKIARLLIRSSAEEEESQLLDERFLATPSVAISQCMTLLRSMGDLSVNCVRRAIALLQNFDQKIDDEVRSDESKADRYEDMLGSYLVKLSSKDMNAQDSNDTAKMLHLLSDFERISDHSVSILYSAEEKSSRGLEMSPAGYDDLNHITAAVLELVDMTFHAFNTNDIKLASKIEPLSQLVINMKEILRTNHIFRLQAGECTIEMGLLLTDILTDLERIASHCSNVAGCMLEMVHDDLDLHEYLRRIRHSDSDFADLYDQYCEKFVPDSYREQMKLHRESQYSISSPGIFYSNDYDA